MIASADLTIKKEATPDPVAPGGELTYKLTVKNEGPNAAEDVVVTDTLEGFLAFVKIEAPDYSVSAPDTGASGPITCKRTAPLAAGQSTTITIVAQVRPASPGSTAPDRVSNTATVNATTPDPKPANTATVTTTVKRPPQTRTALVIFASRDGLTHFPAKAAQRATVLFDDNVPRGDALINLVKSLTTDQTVNAIMLAGITALDAGAADRARAVVDAVGQVQGRSVMSRTGGLSDADKQELTKIGVSLAGIDEVIYLEPNSPPGPPA